MSTGTTGVFAWLAGAGLTGVGVPMALGGSGGGRGDALNAVIRVQRTDPEAAAALASHQCVIGALLAGRNAGLRELQVPLLARGDLSGIWPSSAMDDMLLRGTAAVQAIGVGRALKLTGPLGRVDLFGRQPIVLLCPIQWSASHPPGLALLDGGRDGLRFQVSGTPADGASATTLASLDGALLLAEELVDADGSRIAMRVELQALHATVRGWLKRNSPDIGGREPR